MSIAPWRRFTLPDKFRFLTSSLLDLVFPVRCLSCQAQKNALQNPVGSFCNSCQEKIQLNSWLFCPTCNRKLLGLKACATHSAASLKILGVACNYQEVLVKRLIWQYKYNLVESLAQPLARILSSYFQKVLLPLGDPALPFLVCPLPLSSVRERWRGFNQAQLLAQNFAEQNHLPWALLLKRISFDHPQVSSQSRQERFANVKDCFCITDKRKLQNYTLLLVDDICTSGATLLEAAKTLKKAGAKKVYGLVLARNM